jgi:hypothetical protein
MLGNKVRDSEEDRVDDTVALWRDGLCGFKKLGE